MTLGPVFPAATTSRLRESADAVYQARHSVLTELKREIDLESEHAT